MIVELIKRYPLTTVMFIVAVYIALMAEILT
jgi:hypothetical protein